jgi:hypothetical protein
MTATHLGPGFLVCHLSEGPWKYIVTKAEGTLLQSIAGKRASVQFMGRISVKSIA